MTNPTFMKTYINGLDVPVENTIDVIGIIYFSIIVLAFVLVLTFYSHFCFTNFKSFRQ